MDTHGHLWPSQPAPIDTHGLPSLARSNVDTHSHLRPSLHEFLPHYSENHARPAHFTDVAGTVGYDDVYEVASKRLENFRKVRELRQRLLARSTFA
jgi:hypothetical protein